MNRRSAWPAGKAESLRHETALTGLCFIYALRVLGLYMLLPVLSVHAQSLRGATDLLTGAAMGAYGLTQALFQIPLGHLSDRIGRRRTIGAGLLCLAAGSMVAAPAQNIWQLIVGRGLQGVGAISAAVVALVSDLTPPADRTRAMARLGVWLAAAFAVGMSVGPWVASQFGVRWLLWGTGIAAVFCAVFLLTLVPRPAHESAEEPVHLAEIGAILRSRPLTVLNVGMFLLHTILTVLFVVLPYRLAGQSRLESLWSYVLPLIAAGVVTMLTTSRLADRSAGQFAVFRFGAWTLLGACAAFTVAGHDLGWSLLGVLLFVLALASLEPVLTALSSRLSAGPHRGTALGVFHLAQFTGAFVGGLLGGTFLERDLRALFAGLAAIVLGWLWIGLRTGELRGVPSR